jgi:hypothetical protein
MALVVGCNEPAAQTATPPPAPKAPAKTAAVTPVPVVAPLLHWQSTGLLAVSTSAEGLRLKEVMSLPSSALVRSNTLHKLAHSLPAILFPEAPATPAQAEKLKPLLNDLLAYETEFVWLNEQPARWHLAVKIPVERTGIWSVNLYDLLVRGELLNKIPRTNLTGAAYVAAYSANETYTFGLKDGVVTVERSDTNFSWAPILKSLPARETNAWLALGLQTRLLPVVGDFFAPGNQPYAQLTMVSKGENQVSKLTLKFPQPVGITPEPWQVPTQTIRDPVISFTAIQGIDGWWQRQAWFKPLNLASIPKQAYVWAQSDVPLQTFAAFPARGASNLVASSLSRWTNEFGMLISTNLAGRPAARSNELNWVGLPVFAPYLKAAPEPKDDHLLFGVFPMSPNSTNLPPELIQQFVGRPNSIYYDWEITEARVTQLLQMAPFIFMSANRMLVANSVQPYTLLKDMAPKLGNTVTEATLIAPDEIKVLRKSPIGLSGIELYLLVRWVDQNKFPYWDTTQGVSMRLPALPGAPAAPPAPK